MNDFKIIDKRNKDLIQKINYKENKDGLRGILFASSYLFFFFIYATIDILNMNSNKDIIEFLFFLIINSALLSLLTIFFVVLIPFALFYLGSYLKWFRRIIKVKGQYLNMFKSSRISDRFIRVKIRAS